MFFHVFSVISGGKFILFIYQQVLQIKYHQYPIFYLKHMLYVNIEAVF